MFYKASATASPDAKSDVRVQKSEENRVLCGLSRL